MLTQLGTWARLGFFTRTGFGTYAPSTPTPEMSSTGPTLTTRQYLSDQHQPSPGIDA